MGHVPDHLRDFNPLCRMLDRPARAPSRRLRPDGYPSGHTQRDHLARDRLGPDSTGAIPAAILGRGWSPWLIGAPRPPHSFTGVSLEMRYGAAWAMAPGTTPAEARGAALVACLDEPPGAAAARATVPRGLPRHRRKRPRTGGAPRVRWWRGAFRTFRGRRRPVRKRKHPREGWHRGYVADMRSKRR